MSEPVARRGPHRLTDDQAMALKAIAAALDSREQRTLLLHGVTGSGKTEVYIQAIEKVVGFGRQAIVLVPEISLTPQTVARFRERFDDVAVLHSHQSDVERHREWRRIAAGGVQVVVGARSAVFAPTPHLGLVIIDEEHETSFKQETAPRYHAREVALERTRDLGIPLVLGSATPSLESWHHAQQGRYELIDMPRRVSGRSLPGVQVVDMTEERRSGPGRFLLSRRLQQTMEAVLRDRGQIILMLNRRGYSTHLQCPACAEVVKCPECDTALTYHRAGDAALCHWCDFRAAPPESCPACKDNNIRYSGSGTQQLEAAVNARFPNESCLRMDTDTMRRRGSHERALDAFRRGDHSILLGTQMIAKGLDFPNVTLVGVINADVALHRPDFRAAERTFQLVTQVAGRNRAGRRGWAGDRADTAARPRRDCRRSRPQLPSACRGRVANPRGPRPFRRLVCCIDLSCGVRSSSTPRHSPPNSAKLSSRGSTRPVSTAVSAARHRPRFRNSAASTAITLCC